MKKFLADSKMFELDRHYKECKKSNQPFIKARKNPVDNNYLVHLDLGTCDHNLTKDDEIKLQKIFQDEIDYLEKNRVDSSVYKGSNIDKEYAWYDGILPERLDSFCNSLFDIVDKTNLRNSS